MMEFFGIPVVVTVQDVLGIGGIAICICAFLISIPILLVDGIARASRKSRKRHL